MEKSLNSSRNFKLPPIQGAAPAANILRQPTTRGNQTWPHEYGHRSSHRSTPQVIHVPNDPFPGRYRSPRHVSHNLSNAAGQRRAFNSGAIENEMSRGETLTLGFAPMVHNFPQSYTVLPPIQKISKPSANENEIATRDKASRCEEEKNLSAKSINDVGKPSNKHKTDDAQKGQDNSEGSNTHNNNVQSDSGNATNGSKKKRRTDTKNQDSETGERKQSATTLLFLKGKRIGRRVGVCLENEPALINVTEQLKEIFLRRNMEEMYLI